MADLDFEGFGVITGDDIRNEHRDLTMSEEFGSIPLALTDPDVWANYTDERIYELDKAVRAYISAMRYRQQRDGGYKTAEPLVFMWIFGRKQKPSDSQTAVIIHRLLTWYCTEVRKNTTIAGKTYGKVYCFSRYAAQNKRPYSIRLRIEMDYGGSAFDKRAEDSMEKSPEARSERGCRNAGMSYDITRKRTYGN